jgi:hypothetical protein
MPGNVVLMTSLRAVVGTRLSVCDNTLLSDFRRARWPSGSLRRTLLESMPPAAGNGNELVGSFAQFIADIVDQEIEAAIAADNPGERFPTDRLRRGKNHGLDAPHPFAPAHLWLTFDTDDGLSVIGHLRLVVKSCVRRNGVHLVWPIRMAYSAWASNKSSA